MNIPPRAYAQYRNKPKFMAWLDIAHKMGGDIESAALAVRRSYDIDTAAGESLNVIGRIVVVDRGFISDIPLGQLSFADVDMEPAQCGDDSAMMSEMTAATDSTMSDAIFRLAIKAKIAKNNGDATIPSILDQVDQLIPGLRYVAIADYGDMTFAIEFQGDVDAVLRWALFNADLIQRPAGVQFDGFIELSDFTQFGDEAAMFGDPAVMFAPQSGPGAINPNELDQYEQELEPITERLYYLANTLYPERL